MVLVVSDRDSKCSWLRRNSKQARDDCGIGPSAWWCSSSTLTLTRWSCRSSPVHTAASLGCTPENNTEQWIVTKWVTKDIIIDCMPPEDKQAQQIENTRFSTSNKGVLLHKSPAIWIVLSTEYFVYLDRRTIGKKRKLGGWVVKRLQWVCSTIPWITIMTDCKTRSVATDFTYVLQHTGELGFCIRTDRQKLKKRPVHDTSHYMLMSKNKTKKKPRQTNKTKQRAKSMRALPAQLGLW